MKGALFLFFLFFVFVLFYGTRNKNIQVEDNIYAKIMQNNLAKIQMGKICPDWTLSWLDWTKFGITFFPLLNLN